MKLKVYLSIGLSGCNREDVLEVDDDEWNACETFEEKERFKQECLNEWSYNYIDSYCEVVD